MSSKVRPVNEKNRLLSVNWEPGRSPSKMEEAEEELVLCCCRVQWLLVLVLTLRHSAALSHTDCVSDVNDDLMRDETRTTRN